MLQRHLLLARNLQEPVARTSATSCFELWQVTNSTWNLYQSLIVQILTSLEWIQKAELVCNFCTEKTFKWVFLLCLMGDAFVIYQQLTTKSTLYTALATDIFIEYKQFIAWCLNLRECMDYYLAELQKLSVLFVASLSTAWHACSLQDFWTMSGSFFKHNLAWMPRTLINCWLRLKRWGGRNGSNCSNCMGSAQYCRTGRNIEILYYRCNGLNHMVKEWLSCQEEMVMNVKNRDHAETYFQC